MIFGGSEEATQHQAETTEEIPVAAATRHEAKVIKQDDDGANAQQCKHQNRNPLRAFTHIVGNGRGVTRRGLGGWVGVLLVRHLSRLCAFRGGSSAGASF